MLDPGSFEYDINYVNMLVCGAFAFLMGVFFLSITLSSVVRRLAVEPSREQLYSPQIFRFFGLLLLAGGIGWIGFSYLQPF
jgi:hypothetical protein